MISVDLIREFLHLLASLFIWPVLLSLLALAALTVIWTGKFAREAIERRKSIFRERGAGLRRLDEVAARASDAELDMQLERAIRELNGRRWRTLHRSRIPVRVGPSLGLMGTLIPMASALAGLASGNLPSLASNMVTAFAATVIGLAISVVNYLISSFREDWVREDVRELAFRAEQLLRNRTRATEGAAFAIR